MAWVRVSSASTSSGADGTRSGLDIREFTEHTHYEYKDNRRADDPLSESTTFSRQVRDVDFDVEQYNHRPPTRTCASGRAAVGRGTGHGFRARDLGACRIGARHRCARTGVRWLG